jgi:hypothetical protein
MEVLNKSIASFSIMASTQMQQGEVTMYSIVSTFELLAFFRTTKSFPTQKQILEPKLQNGDEAQTNKHEKCKCIGIKRRTPSPSMPTPKKTNCDMATGGNYLTSFPTGHKQQHFHASQPAKKYQGQTNGCQTKSQDC